MPFFLLLLALLPLEPLAAEPHALFLGDSISYGKFGLGIDTTLRSQLASVTTVASCGTSPSAWASRPAGTPYIQTTCGYWKKTDTSEERTVRHLTPRAAEELAAHPAEVTVVQLGTNVAAGRPERQRLSSRQLMEDILRSGSHCIWIGPPDANSTVVTRAKLAATNAMLQEEALRVGCAYIDTLSFTHFPAGAGDGIHPSPTLAAEWARQVAARLIPLLP